MKKFKLLIFTLIGMLVLAACSSAEPETAVNDSAETDTVAVVEETTDDAMSDDSMAEDEMMEDDSHSDDAMMEEDAMAEDESMASDDEMMEDDAHSDDTMMEEDAMADDESMAADDDMMEESSAAGDRPEWQQIPLTNAQTGETFTFADFADKTVFVEPMATWCTNCRRQLDSVLEAQAQLGDDVVFIGLSVETNIAAADLAKYAADNGYESFVWAVMTPDILQALADVFGQSVANPPSTPHFIIATDGTSTQLDTGFEDAAELVAQISDLQ